MTVEIDRQIDTQRAFHFIKDTELVDCAADPGGSGMAGTKFEDAMGA